MQFLIFRSALCYAVKHGNVPFVKKLIEKGAIINIADDKKNKPLFYINEKLKLEPKNENFIAIKKLLVENKAELWDNLFCIVSLYSFTI